MATKPGLVKKLTGKIKKDNERGARVNLIEDLFYDFNRSRTEVFKINFFRGIFFGFGTVLGGTVLIAIIVWVLSFFVDLPGIGDTVEQLQQSLRNNNQ